MRDRLDIWATLLTILLVVLAAPVVIATWHDPLLSIGVLVGVLVIYTALLGAGSIALLSAEGRRNREIARFQREERAMRESLRDIMSMEIAAALDYKHQKRLGK